MSWACQIFCILLRSECIWQDHDSTMFCVRDMWSDIICVASTCSQCLVAVMVLPDLGYYPEGKTRAALCLCGNTCCFTSCMCNTCSQCLVTFTLLPYVLVSYVINYVHLFPICVCRYNALSFSVVCSFVRPDSVCVVPVIRVV